VTAPVEPTADEHDTALGLLVDSAPSGSHDAERRRPEATPDDDHGLETAGALAVLRRGLHATPELRQGIVFTLLMAIVTAGGKLAVPVLIQQILDRGVLRAGGFRPTFVYTACAAAAVLVLGFYVASRATFLRLVRAAEHSLFGLRVRTFGHIHQLSMAEHGESRRGALVARVTSDVETLAQFTEWGAVAWIVDGGLVVGTLAIMAIYSWQLALVAVAAFLPLIPILRVLQRRQLAAYDRVRESVGTTMSEVSELVGGAPVVQAYGLQRRSRARLQGAIQSQFRAQMGAARYFALMFPLSDMFGALALASVVGAGARYGQSWGLELGELIAFVFLVSLLLTPIAELSEILDQTQTAIAGWRKILGVLGTPIDVVEPVDGVVLPDGPLAVDVESLSFAYRGGIPVLRGIDLHLQAGSNVAVVGETGSGKTTFAKLLCRLADPTDGALRVGGTELAAVDPASRRLAIRLVPQDGFLFDAPLRENVAYGRPGADDAEIRASFAALGLSWWLDDLPYGLDTPVGERGGNLSVGERQLVALARAQLGNPGLLILDEATSAVDPETERALTEALARLAEGRTVISIAHRLSTAERADLVLVFDDGRIVERGTHTELLATAGTYAGLYRSWLGNTRTEDDI
jgi:putative ABC transport system ATP-binding protein